MSDARILNAAARLVQAGLLRPMYTICETQHQVGTAKLERYLEDVAEQLKTCAFEIRMGYDAMKKERDQLRAEIAKARELLEQAKPKLWAASAGDLPRNIDEWLERSQ